MTAPGMTTPGTPHLVVLVQPSLMALAGGRLVCVGYYRGPAKGKPSLGQRHEALEMTAKRVRSVRGRYGLWGKDWRVDIVPQEVEGI